MEFFCIGKVRPIQQKAFWAGCARICGKEYWMSNWGWKKMQVQLECVQLQERTYMLWFHDKNAQIKKRK